MPVIYDRDMGRQWLEEATTDPLVLSLIAAAGCVRAA
jgi:hypothetical protein